MAEREEPLLTMEDVLFEGRSLREVERLVEGKRLDPQLKRYLGSAWRVIGVRGWDPNDVNSACVGFVALEPQTPSPESLEWGRRVVREYEASLADPTQAEPDSGGANNREDGS